VVNPENLRFGGKLGLANSQLSTLHWYLKWTMPIWAVVDFNSVLNRWAENRWLWKTDRRMSDWKREIALVISGSAGIAACVVKKLTSYRIRVAVLDIRPPSEGCSPGLLRHRIIAFHTNENADERALVQYYKYDITSRDNIHQAAATVLSDLGSPSISINNAGIGNA
jgi:all-trans-retinol dehydrogenase (NAD+)